MFSSLGFTTKIFTLGLMWNPVSIIAGLVDSVDLHNQLEKLDKDKLELADDVVIANFVGKKISVTIDADSGLFVKSKFNGLTGCFKPTTARKMIGTFYDKTHVRCTCGKMFWRFKRKHDCTHVQHFSKPTDSWFTEDEACARFLQSNLSYKDKALSVLKNWKNHFLFFSQSLL